MYEFEYSIAGVDYTIVDFDNDAETMLLQRETTDYEYLAMGWMWDDDEESIWLCMLTDWISDPEVAGRATPDSYDSGEVCATLPVGGESVWAFATPVD